MGIVSLNCICLRVSEENLFYDFIADSENEFKK